MINSSLRSFYDICRTFDFVKANKKPQTRGIKLFDKLLIIFAEWLNLLSYNQVNYEPLG